MKTILSIEDDAINRKVIEKMLLKAGNFNYSFAENGDRALKMLQENSYDLIFLDMHLPDMDGFAILEKLNRSQNGFQTPVVLVSSDRFSEQEINNAGIQGVLNKPIQFTELQAILKEILV